MIEWISVKDKVPSFFSDSKDRCEYDYCFIKGNSINGSPIFGIGQYRDGKFEVLNGIGAGDCDIEEEFEEVLYWCFCD